MGNGKIRVSQNSCNLSYLVRQRQDHQKTVQLKVSLHKFVYLKLFWSLFKNVHCHGPCSLRPTPIYSRSSERKKGLCYKKAEKHSAEKHTAHKHSAEKHTAKKQLRKISIQQKSIHQKSIQHKSRWVKKVAA